MAESKIILLNPDTADRTVYTVDSAVVSTKTFKIATGHGNLTARFTEGVYFDLISGGNAGLYTIVSSSWDTTNTYVIVSETLSNTDGGTIAWYEYLEFVFGARATPAYTMPGQRTVDRLGRPHRTTPVSSNKNRYVATVTLSIEVSELYKLTNNNNRLEDFIYNECIEGDTLFYVFAYKQSLDNDGTSFTTKRAYQAYLEEIPSYIFDTEATMDGDRQDRIELPMLVVNDGTWTDWGSLTTLTWRR